MKFVKNQIMVDPGWNTALAVFGKEKTLHPVTYLFEIEKDWDELKKMDYLSDKFAEILEKYSPRIVHIEDVGLWGHSAASMASAQRGDTFRLAMLVGQFIRECQVRSIKVILHRPIDWKGNMNKDMVKKRVQRRNGMVYEDFYGSKAEHVYDAVGIGLSVMRVL